MLAGFSSVFAQNEISVDSLHTNIFPKGGTQEETVLPEVKNYDGFLLDMSLMKMTPPQLPKFTLEIPDASKDYSSIFRLNPNTAYSQGFSNKFSLSNSIVCRLTLMENIIKTAGESPTLLYCRGKRITSKEHSN